MAKKLSEMTLEELWQLFPVVLTEHKEFWKEWYSEEETLLSNRLPCIYRISHIGAKKMYEIIDSHEGAKRHLYSGKRIMIK